MYLTLSTSIAAAQQSEIQGHQVYLRILTYNDPQNPIMISRTYSSTVTDGIEFGAGKEGRSGVDVIPVLVNIQNGRVEFSYQMIEFPGAFTAAAFNGYELTFNPCLEFQNVRLGYANSIGMSDQRVFSVGSRIFVNVSALGYAQISSFAVNFETRNCPPS
jgi:hypothetical protein